MRATTFVVVIAVLGLASSAQACPSCSTSSLKCLPGFYVMAPFSAVALYLLSAIIERPFVTMAGVTEGAMAHSLVTAFLSFLIVGIGGVFVPFVGWPRVDLAFPWMLLSIVFAAAIRYFWLTRRGSRWRHTVTFWPLLLGAITSAFIIFLLPVLQMIFGFDTRSHALRVQHLQFPVFMLTVTTGICAVVVAFYKLSQEPRIDDPPPGRGFEVMPAPAAAEPLSTGVATSSASGT